MINSIVNHTNSYAREKIFGGLGSSYTISNGSWQDVTADEIRRFIALLIHFCIVRVQGDVQKNWSTKTLYHGLWAHTILPRKRYFAILAMLHVVHPATEDPQNKLCPAPQCQGKHMHVTKARNCFHIFHSREYHSQ